MSCRKAILDPFHLGASVVIIIDSQLRFGVIDRVVPPPAKSNKLPSIWVKLDDEGRVFSRRQNEVAPIYPEIHRELIEEGLTPAPTQGDKTP